MRRADRVFGFICLGLSIWLILESRNYDYMTTFTPGPGFHPFWLGVLLAVLSACLLGDTFRRRGAGEDGGAGLLGKGALLRAGSILLITAGLAFFMTRIGFVPASFLFVTLTLTNYLFKVGVEALMTPLTYAAVNRLKKAEAEDYFDRGTNFNPFAA